MAKQEFSIAGITQLLILFSLLICVLALSSPSVSSQGAAGCCANPGVLYGQFDNSFYCGEGKMYSLICCPGDNKLPLDGHYNSSDLSGTFPKNQADCNQNFYASTCAGLDACNLGCCYNPNADPSLGYCSLSTKYICLLDQGADWREGGCSEDFHGCPAEEIPGNNTKNSTSGTDTCSQYDLSPDVKGACIANGCTYCPLPTNKCFSDCFGNCPGSFVDQDSDHICDSNDYYQSCPDNVICQAQQPAICRCGNGLALTGQYCCELLGENFTSQDECNAACGLSCGINQKISDFFTSNYYDVMGYTKCKCGAQTADLYTDANRYCCLINGVTGLKDTECYPQATLSGFVYEAGTPPNKPIKGAQVTVGANTANADATGAYTLAGIPAGVDLVAVASNDSFIEQAVNINLVSGSNTLDFYLTPFFSSCDNPKTFPDLGFGKECLSDSKGIRLTWVNPCPSQFVMFQLYRNNTPIGPQSFIGSGPFVYTDTDFPWESNLNYSLKTTYLTAKGNGVMTDSIMVFTGYEACQGKAGKSICSNGKIINCGDGCTSSSYSCGGTACVELASGDAMCVAANPCENLGNPFGVFYDKNTCYFNTLGQPNPCYYDYSQTTIDKCYRCYDAASCSAFLSGDACLNNPCGLSSLCSYISTNAELGKGICYRNGGFNSDSCELCNKPFMDCTSQICSEIGNCGMTGSGCKACKDVKSCLDYADDFSCTGNQPYIRNTGGSCAAISVTLSNDSCGIGYCRWLNSMCIRDIDYNGIQDTNELELPPVTTIKIPSKILGIGDVIYFNVTSSLGFGAQTNTYYCISPSNSSCCPTTQVNGGNIQLTPENNPNIGQGIYRIYYYSNYRNTNNPESVKNALFYADMKAPAITGLSYKTEDYSKVENSNLTIYFNVSENAVCTGTMINAGFESMLKKSIKLFLRQPMQYMVKYINMTDGDYHYFINCTDYAGNTNLSEHIIKIDRVGAILSFSPDYKTLNAKPKVTATVNDDGTCALIKLPTGEIIPSMLKVQNGGLYIFSAVPATAGEGSSIYQIKCTLASGLVDSALSLFTIDTTKPVSTLNYTPPGGATTGINGWYTNDSIFSILCNDPPYPDTLPYNTPPMFGCNGTRYCVAQGTASSCVPSSQYTQSTILNKVYKTTRFCYQSKDAGGNIEDVKCTTVQIDSVPPMKPNVTALPRTVETTGKLNITIISADRGSSNTDGGSGIQYYAYTMLNSTNTSGKKLFAWVTSAILDGKSFLLNISDLGLERGKTYYVAALAVDNSGLESDIGISQPITVICSLGLNKTKCDANGLNCVCDTCGDGIAQAAEECDNGISNNNNGECTLSCKLHRCGDGYLYNYLFLNGTFKGTEECDLGPNNGKSGYSCDANCKWVRNSTSASCGNGRVDPGEECDDGNTINIDACVNCYKAYCGDGYTRFGNESCDYRNPDDRTGCTTSCTMTGPYIPPTCTDGQRNGDEGDVDCGGNCTTKCALFKRCGKNSDCESNLCNITAPSITGFCYPSPTCTNGRVDPGEADKDCGQICTTKCAPGQNCKTNSDCASQVCTAGKCTAGNCTDSILNGNESDVDCGGACTKKCGDGKKCSLKTDCQSGICKSGYCATNPDQDNDGMDDVWEAQYCPSGHCDPNADPDKDGLTNLQEFQHGTDPTKKDTDSDGWTDKQEIDAGTDPNDPADHPQGGLGWLWILLFIILLLGAAIAYYVYTKGKKKKETKTNISAMRQPSFMDQPYQKPLIPPAKQPPANRTAPAAPQRKGILADHSDLFKPFDNMYSEKIESKDTKPAKEAAVKGSKAPGAPDLAEGQEMPGWMKDRSGVWKRLEKMNEEELGRMGKADVDVNGELSGMYGKRLDKNAKDSLSKLVLSGIITKENLTDIMRALSKDGKLNKAVLKYILEDMLSGKKMNKTEMKAMLREFAEKGILSERDSDDMIDFVKEL